jgi:hypothetical protein
LDLEELITRVQAGSWAEKIAAIRSIPAEFPGREHQTVYAAIAGDFYVHHLAPHFHIVPWPVRFLDREGFFAGYAAATKHTDGFLNAEPEVIADAIRAEPRSLRIFRLILGYSPKELSEALASFEGVALGDATINRLEDGGVATARLENAIEALGRLISTVVTTGGYTIADELRDRGFRGKTDKPDTETGWDSVARFASEGVPYSEFLYQLWYGGAFRQLQDAGGRLKGDVLEDAVEDLFRDNGVPYVRTTPGTQATAGERFGVTVQPAPDFILHDKEAPRGLLECKSAGDGGTARDKAARFGALSREANRLSGIPVLAVLEGFGWRRLNDALGPVVRDCDGRVFMPGNLADLLKVDPVRDLIGLDA